MSEVCDLTDGPIEPGVVGCALRAELADRGHHLTGDTAGMRRPLYIMGVNDVARALFEFQSSAGDAVYELMYQGAWVAGMPPRFVVLPKEEGQEESLETLEQMKAIPLLFDVVGGKVTFQDLDALLQEHADLS